MNGNPEAEKVGQIVLVNQFVSGLRSELQAKVLGVEGSMDELVAKARFEEAKSKELSGRSPGLQPKKTYPSKGQSGGHTNRPSLTTPAATLSTQPTPVDQGEMTKEPVTCFQCGMEGHIRSSCPYPRPQKEGAESCGRPQIKNMTSRESPGSPLTGQQKEIQELRGRLRQAELVEAINSAGAVNVVVTAESGPRLGPTVYVPVAVNGVSTDALVDTGSPATIVSLEFTLKVLRQTRPEDQTDAQWIESTREDPDVALKNYGGHQLDFTAQIELSPSRGDRHLTSVVLVRKGAPNNLLVGTDVQPKLGLSVVARDEDGGMTDLLSGQRMKPEETGSDGQPGLGNNQEPEDDSAPTSGAEFNTAATHPVSADRDDSRPQSSADHEVRLLQTVKVPAGRLKLVRANIGTELVGGPMVFTPSEVTGDLQMSDGVVEMGDDKFVTLLLQNHGTDKLCLKRGMRLGVVSPTTVITDKDQDVGGGVEGDPETEVARLQHTAVDTRSRGQPGAGNQVIHPAQR